MRRDNNSSDDTVDFFDSDKNNYDSSDDTVINFEI